MGKPTEMQASERHKQTVELGTAVAGCIEHINTFNSVQISLAQHRLSCTEPDCGAETAAVKLKIESLRGMLAGFRQAADQASTLILMLEPDDETRAKS